MKSPFTLPVALVCLASPAAAQRLEDRVAIQLSGYFPKVDSSINIGLPGLGLGTEIDLEDDLALDDSEALFAFGVGWRINDDWLLAGQFYQVGRSTSATLSRDIAVGDTTYPVNGSVTAGFESNIYRATITNLLFQRPGFEFGAAIGLHATGFTFFIEGAGAVGGNPGQFRREQRNIFAPLPTVGGLVRWQPRPRLEVTAKVDWLSLTLGDYSGRLINAEASAGYRVWRTVDLGVLVRRVDYRVDVTKDNWVGGVSYKFWGPAIFAQVGF
jgi:hypothetical protein